MALSPEDAKKLKDQIKETEDLASKFAGDMKTVEALVKGTASNFGKIVDLAGKLDSASKKEKKLREDIRDLQKEVLENAENIGTEEFKSLDVATKLAKARRMGDKSLVKQLTHLKDINKLQQQQNKQLTAAANLIKKPFEALDSAIRQIPVIGELLGDVADFGGLGDNIAQGMIEGFTSGLVETNFSRMMATTFNSAGRLIDRESGQFVKQGFFIMMITRIREGLNSLSGSFSSLTLSGRAFTGILVLGAAALVKMVASSVKFANETGLAYSDMLRMGPALLFNADAVKSFADELGTVNNLTGMQALRLQLIEKRFGLSAESAAKLFAVQRGITGVTMDQFISQQKTVGLLARQAGVAPKAVFDDMAQNAEFIAKFSDATGDSMARAAIEARRMGINLGKVESIAEGLLDFETSIEKQMEAQVLLGRSINLDKARELFFNNKSAEGLREVANQLGGIGKLNEMDFVQRKAIADLLNIQVGDLAKVMGAQEGVNEATKKSVSGAVMLGIGLGAAAGLAAAIIPAMISTIPGLQKVGIRQLGKGLAVVAGGAAAGGVAGGMIGGFMTESKGKLPELASGGVIVGERGPEVVAPLPNQGVNVDNSGMEKRMDMLMEQNQVLMRRLTNTVADMKMA